MKTLGLIGGTSWHSTIAYYRYLNSMVNQRRGKLVSPPLLIYSINVAVMATNDWEQIRQTFLEGSLKLEAAGAQALIFCANTPHKTYPYVAPQLQIPILHIADATAEAARQQGLQKLGLLGTLPVMQEDFISGRIQSRFGISCLTPTAEGRQTVHRIVVEELVQGIFREESKKRLIAYMQELRERGAEGIILGCTEFSLLIKQEEVDMPLLDTTWLHAHKAVSFILEDAPKP